MERIKYSIIMYCLLISIQSFGQKDSLAIVNVFNQSKAIYDSTDFQLNTEYKAFVRKQQDSLVKYLKGTVVKKGDYSYSQMGETEMIQNKNKKLTISHQEKLVQYKVLTSKNGFEQLANIEQIITLFSSYTFTQQGNHFICTFEAPKINQLPFTKVEVIFDKEYYILKQTMYMSESIPYTFGGVQKYASTRIEIEFSKATEFVKPVVQKKISDYVTVDVTSSRAMLTSKLKGYQLVE